MLWVGSSDNGEVSLPLRSLAAGLCGLVYGGPTARRVPVEWTLDLIGLIPSGAQSMETALRVAGSDEVFVGYSTIVRSIGVGDRFRIRGRQIMDLASGDQLVVTGGADTAGVAAVVAGGLVVYVG